MYDFVRLCVVITIIGPYLSEVVGMTSAEIGIVALGSQATGILSAYLTHKLNIRVGLKVVFLVDIALWLLVPFFGFFVSKYVSILTTTNEQPPLSPRFDCSTFTSVCVNVICTAYHQFLKGPEDVGNAPIGGVVIGLALGAGIVLARVIMAGLIPKGHEAEVRMSVLSFVLCPIDSKLLVVCSFLVYSVSFLVLRDGLEP